MTVASTLAQTIVTQLGTAVAIPAANLSGADYALPSKTSNPRYAAVPEIDIETLTTGVVDGAGAFDKIMASHKAHLQEQFEKNRITGDQYTKAYVELTTAALSAAMQFVLQSRIAYWQELAGQNAAQAAEIAVVKGRVELDTAKQQYAAAVSQAHVLKAQEALTEMQVANEDAKHTLALAQIELVGEQTEVQRGQTLDTRTDGAAVKGIVGKQKDLYTQQVSSYKSDSELKAAKMWLDGWITQKTLDEGLVAPTQLQNTDVNEVLAKIRTNLNMN